MFTKKTNHRFSDGSREPCTMLTPIWGFNDKSLVTLEQAIVPLIPIVRDIQKQVAKAKSRVLNHTNNLSIDESAAIILYTMEWHPYTDSLYYILNTKLRNEDREHLKPWFLYLKLIFTALSRLPTMDLTVYRGVVLSNYKKYQPEKTVVWWGFSSCSANRNIVENKPFFGNDDGRTLFIIDCLKGVDISQHSCFRKEKEILLLPGTTLKITQCYQMNDIYVIHLKQIESPHQLLQSVSTDSEIEILRSTSMLNNTQPYLNSKLNTEISRFKDNSHACLFQKRFTDNDIEIVVKEVIGIKKCRVLILRGNELTIQGVLIIANSLENNNTLEELYLTDIQIDDIGVQALAKSLSNQINISLHKLCLNHNGITDKGAEYLSEMLKINKSLTHLWLPKNLISDRGIQSLAEALIINKTLQTLSLEWNVFENDKTIDILIKMMNKNQTLIEVDIDGRDLSRSDIKKLKDIAKLKNNFKLKIH